MPPYSFPFLGTKDIANGLANVGIRSVTPEQLLKINSETTAHLYECFMQNIMTDGSSIFCGLEILEDQELHKDFLGIINTISKIKQVMEAAGAHYLFSKDIFKPDPQCTLKLLSALINFSCYRLEHELGEIEAERRSKQPQIEAYELEFKELNQNILALNKQQSNLQAEVQNLKEKNTDYNDKVFISMRPSCVGKW